MAPSVSELIVWTPECGPETQLPVVTLLCLRLCLAVVKTLRAAEQVNFCGPVSSQRLCGL